jgi:TM2 domain-containing membrane protein YozV
MKYYFVSLFITIIIFIIIQYLEYNKKVEDYENQEPYNLFSLNNLLLFIIIYIVLTTGLFYLNGSNTNFFSFLEIPNKSNVNNNNNNEIKTDIDPKVLSKINDNFDTGFAPFNSDDDSSSLSSMSSNNSI